MEAKGKVQDHVGLQLAHVLGRNKIRRIAELQPHLSSCQMVKMKREHTTYPETDVFDEILLKLWLLLLDKRYCELIDVPSNSTILHFGK
jgi:hypothetical protein